MLPLMLVALVVSVRPEPGSVLSSMVPEVEEAAERQYCCCCFSRSRWASAARWEYLEAALGLRRKCAGLGL